jgi:hypothetical protein
MKVSELTGAELDYWVAKAEELPLSEEWNCSGSDGVLIGTGQGDLEQFAPSTNWAHGGPIIERERIETRPESNGFWRSFSWGGADTSGASPLEAAMRAYVVSKFGEEVEDLPA